MKIIGIIPARMDSSRFPGKPLASLCGLSMIEHVYKRAKMSKILNGVYIATCDQAIKEAARKFGGEVFMTKNTHERASDRVAEALLKIESKGRKKADVVVMIQGDEPMVFPEMIRQSCQPLIKDRKVPVTNLMSALKSREEQDDANEVKVVVDKNNFALYFSREPIPSWKKGARQVPMFKQVCIIAFRREFLLKFNRLKQTPLEKVESVDMLRVLENGYPVKMVPTAYETYSVDTPEDLKAVEKLMKQDPLLPRYGTLSSDSTW